MATDLAQSASGAADELEFTLSVDGVTGTLLPATFTVHEELSQLYELDVTFSSADEALVLGDLIGKAALLTSTTPGGERHWHGIIRRVEVVGRRRATTRFRARIVPRLWFATQRADCRIFQAKSAPDIVCAVLEAVGVSGDALENRLRKAYQPRDYCVQYHETDFAFVSRLMEKEGIYYFFAHSAEGHVLVLVDDPWAHDALPSDPTILYRAPSFATSGGQVASEVRFEQSIVPNQHTFQDYTFKAPDTELAATAGPASAEGEDDDRTFEDVPLEIYEYPGGYVEASLGADLSTVRLEAERARARQLHAVTNVRRVAAGATFALAEHPRGALNRRYLLVSASHRGRQPLPDDDDPTLEKPTYRNEVVAIPENVPFRAPRTTPRPVIPGIQTAIVTGPPGEEIHVDEFGRVKVQFHWDRVQPRDDTSSCWVRVSHAWAGTGFGHLFLPRIGQEVVVQFLEGDPDRPMVIGRVYNGDNALPNALPADKNKSTIRSNSTPGGGGFNEITFDDTAGSEELFINGQKNATINTGNNKTETVAVDATCSVGSNSSLSVGADMSVSVGGNRTVSVTGDETIAVTGNRTETVSGNDEVTVTGNRTSTVSGNRTESVTGNGDQTITGNKTVSVTGNNTETISGNTTASVSGNSAETVTGNRSVTVSGTQAHAVTGAMTVDASASLTETIGADWSLNASANVTLGAGANVDVTAGSAMTLGAPTITVSADGTLTLTAGGSSITIDASGVTISGPKINLN